MITLVLGEMEIAPACLLHHQLVLARTHLKDGYCRASTGKDGFCPTFSRQPQGSSHSNLTRAVSAPAGVGSCTAWKQQ